MARVLELTRRKINAGERLFNLAVEEDESFVVNGVVVHNCKSYIRPILAGNLGNKTIERLKPSTKAIEDKIQFSDRD